MDAAHQEAQGAEGWKDDELETPFTDFMLQSAETVYKKAKTIMSPDDPRLKVINSALLHGS